MGGKQEQQTKFTWQRKKNANTIRLPKVFTPTTTKIDNLNVYLIIMCLGKKRSENNQNRYTTTINTIIVTFYNKNGLIRILKNLLMVKKNKNINKQ